ncbi:MAG: AEC family transporter [Rhodospirillales bacterium]|nr:AEC family transporter [Rhodospirillales bacterium]
MIGVLLDAVLPIFAVAALGFAAGRIGLFDNAMASIINRFVFYLPLPVLCFKLLANAPFEKFDWLLLSGYFLSEVAVYALGFLVARLAFKCGWRESILLGMAAAFSNHVLFVLPIALTLFGDGVTLPIVAIITVDTLLIFGATLLLMDILTLEKPSVTGLVIKLVKNPPVMGMASGLVFGSLGVDLPTGINTFLDFVSTTAAPCALFAMGVVLSDTTGSTRTALPVAISALKVVGHPLLAVAVIVFGFEISPETARPALMTAAGPCGAMAFVMALNYNVKVDAIARAILFAMIASVVTVTLMAAY